MRRVLLPLALVLGLVGCGALYNSSATRPSALESQVAFTTERVSLAADGVTTTRLTLQVPTNAAREMVTFAASDGVFTIGSSSAEPKKATVQIDSTGKAVTELRSTTTVGTVSVSASVTFLSQQITKTETIAFAPPTADSEFLLSTSATTLPADGFSRARITAKLQFAGGTPAQRTVTFAATNGALLFAAGQASGATTQNVVADSDGVANVDLQSTKSLNSVTVTAAVAGTTRQVSVAQTAATPDTIIRLSVPSTAPADGRSLSSVVATVAAGLPEGRRTVTFSASPTNIALSQASVVADGSNRAITDMTSATTTGAVRITATVDGTSASGTIQLIPALPDSILVAVSAPTVRATATDNVTVTVTLARDTGTVTAGTVVVLRAVDGTGASVGTFSASTTSNASGTATAQFFPGVAAPIGAITIIASVNGVSVTGSVRLVINP